jgi:hypothetical protein
MQKKLISLLPNWFKAIPHFDKILHLIAGLVIYFLSCLFLNNVYALLIVFTLALGKEYFDGTSTRQSFFDFLATFLAPLLICIIQNI